MKVSEALRRISFKIGTPDDISGRAVNSIINNRYIIDELNSQLRQYATITKGIQDIYSVPLNTNTPFLAAPTLALRSESYFFAYIIANGTIFPMDIRGAADTIPRFRYAGMTGITNWLMPWNAGATKYLSTFPMKNASAQTTTLNGALTATATTITVTSTTGFIANHGRITIDSEKILYTYVDSTHFYGCVRGVEMTTAAAHDTATTVSENNLVLFYSRLPVKLVVTDDDVVPNSIGDLELEPCEEHMEGIIKLVAYNLLIKLDPERALVYKLDGDDLFRQYAIEIRRGYAKNRQGAGVRQPFPFNEAGVPFGTNMIY